MAEEIDSVSSVAEEGDTLSPPETVLHPKQEDSTTNKSSDELKSSSRNGAVEEEPDLLIPIPLRNAKPPIGGGPTAILGFSEQDQKQNLGRIPVQSLEIQVIDDTALIGAISMPKLAFRRATLKNPSSKEKENMERKNKTTNATRKGAKSVLLETNKKKNVKMGKIRYSREVMESLRFENVVDQRRMWKKVVNGLGPLVRKEYDFLLSSMQYKNVHFLFHGAQGKKKESGPSDFGAITGRGRWNHTNVYVH